MQGADFGAWIGSIGLGGLFTAVEWASVEGWRIAFVVVGVPGVLIALLVLLTIKEPPRGYSDPPERAPRAEAHWAEAFQELKTKPSFWWMAIGAALVAFVGYGLVSFQAPFLQREHGLDVRDAAINFGAPLSFLAAIGTFMGGYITEKLTPRSPTAVAWVPAVGLLIAVPAYISAFFLDDLKLIFIMWGIAAICHYAYLGAQYNIGQGVVSNRSRATAIAILLILVSLIGNGIGPYFVGFMSDLFMNLQLSSSIFADQLTPALCLARDSVLSDPQAAVCEQANSTGLKQAMAVTVCWFLVAAFCFFMSARTLKRDFVAEL
jgi:MFS family permease